jgi:outer membrane protein assembly factor BamB
MKTTQWIIFLNVFVFWLSGRPCLGQILSDRLSWPDFLGRSASTIIPESIPIEWSPTKNVAWTAKLPGQGQSSPIIFDGKVIVTSIEGSMRETCHVSAFHLESGTQAWSVSYDSSQIQRSNYFQSRSAPTPVATDKGIFCFFETGNLIALRHDGSELWHRSLTDEFGSFESTIGLASSPIADDQKLYVLVDHEGPSYLLAVDQESGETVWKTDRDSRISYSSPSFITVGEEKQILCSSGGGLQSYSLTTGQLEWEFEDIGANTQNTPLVVSDGTFLVGASPGMHGEREASARKSNLCFSVTKKDGKYQPRIDWIAQGVVSTFASPMAHEGYCYWVNKVGVVYCFDAKTGEPQFKERISGECWATPRGIGDKVYFFGKDGVTTVIRSGPVFEKISENTIWDVDNTPRATPGGSGRSRDSNHENHNADKADDTQIIRQSGQSETDSRAPPQNIGRGGAPTSEADRELARQQGENRFADPIQYGVAIVSGSIIIRTGDTVYCVKKDLAE